MSLELEQYRFFVLTNPVSPEEADNIQTAIGMVKGVRAVLLNEVPVVPANDRQILDLYLDQLTSADAPPCVGGGWIRSRLPNLSRYDLRDWVKGGLVDPGIPYPERGGRRLYTNTAAQRVGQLWYLQQIGIVPKVAASMIQQGAFSDFINHKTYPSQDGRLRAS